MSKQMVIQNEKAIVAGISKAINKMESCKKGYVNSVIELGERLIDAKEKVPFGQWENWLKANSELAFGNDQASKFIKVAHNKILVLEYFNNENSVNNLTKAISDASPEQLAKVEELKEAAEQKRLADMEIKVAPVEPVLKKQPEILEGEFVEVKPASEKPAKINIEPKAEEVKAGFVQIDAKELENIEDNMHELASLNKSISKDNDSMSRVFDSNDHLSAAAKEIKRLNDLNTSLEGRLNGFMNERNALIKEAKYWRARFEKLEKMAVANG